MLDARETPTLPSRFAARVPWPTIVAMVLAPFGIVIASLSIPSGVDEIPSSDRRARHAISQVAAHPFGTRLGLLAFAAGMLLLLPALAALRSLPGADPAGHRLLEVGTRLCAIGAAACALGNAFAPATLPSMVHADLPREVMVHFWRYHGLNGWDWTILAFYPLITIGGALIGFGLWRNRAVPRSAALLISLPLVALIFPPFSPPTAVIGFALLAGFVVVLLAPLGCPTP